MSLFKVKLFIIISIFLLGAGLRLGSFWSNPPALNWDEAAIGWNAWSLWFTKRDEHQVRLPLTFESYGDFKAPFMIYLTAPFVGLLGMSEFSIRLPFVIISLFTLIFWYLLSLEIGKRLFAEEEQIWGFDTRFVFSAVSFFLLCVSPWYLLYSRAAFEASVGFGMILFGLLTFFWALKNSWWWFLSGLSFILATYTYHSPKLVLVFFLPFLFLMFRKEIWASLKQHIWGNIFIVLVLFAVLAPNVYAHVMGKAADRGKTSIIFDEKGKLRLTDLNVYSDLAKNTFQHINPLFYTQGDSRNFRNTLAYSGLMPYVQWFFFALGLVYLLARRKKSFPLFLLGWYGIGLLPGILSQPDVSPHSLRSLNALPAMIIFSSFGFVTLPSLLANKKLGFKNFWVSIFAVILFTLNIGFNFYDYFIKYPVYAAKDWQYGYKEAVLIAQKYENDVDQIIFSNQYGQVHEFIQLFQQRPPTDLWWGKMRKYTLRDVNWTGDQFNKNNLLIGAGKQIPDHFPAEMGELVAEIKFPDGEVAFRIVKTRK